MLQKGLEPFPQKLQFCALPVELSKLCSIYGEIGTRTLTSVMQTQNTSLYIISPFSFRATCFKSVETTRIELVFKD